MIQACTDAVNAGVPPHQIVDQIARGAEVVGKKFEDGEYFLSELVMAGEVMKEGMRVVDTHLKTEEIRKIGKVVIGTVRGDIHDIGKNIVAMLLGVANFDVVDLGSDVPPGRFVDAVRVAEPQIVGMSSLLSTTMQEMDDVITDLERAKLRERTKIIIGGNPVTDDFAKRIGADAYGKDAVMGIKICRNWVQG
jgi:trimethylamine corrinoid protein